MLRFQDGGYSHIEGESKLIDVFVNDVAIGFITDDDGDFPQSTGKVFYPFGWVQLTSDMLREISEYIDTTFTNGELVQKE